MDGECVKLLPQVCDVLADSGKCLPDDTSLEKLLDWFGVLTKSVKGLLETCPCLPEFISTVIHDPSPDPGILSFTFKLTGLLAATESSFKQLQEDRVLLGLVFAPPHRWHEAGFWEDPCVRIGWVQGIRAMLQHPLALSFLVDTDLTRVVLQLQTDSSLFVAAAANEVLAHILVHQSQLSERFVATERKERSSVGTTAPTDADLQCLALTLGSGRRYASVAMVILEHVKASLVPREKGDLQRSLQGLRLLVLVFSQAGAPLRGVVLKAVRGALEALVSEAHSRLHLLLLDVLLAASSCSSRTAPTRDPEGEDPDPTRDAEGEDPDPTRDPEGEVSGPGQAAGSLISRMLDSSDPPELIHTAAAILRSDHQDSCHRAQAAGLILAVLQMMTSLPLPGASSAGSAEQRSSLAELMTSRTPCVSLLCVCLSHAPLLTLAPPDALSCPMGSLVTVVLSILRICSGHAPSSLIGSTKACRNLIGCGKVQRCGLEALASLAAGPGAPEKMSDVSSALISYLDHPDSEPTVLQKSYQSLLKWISVCPAPSSFLTDTLGHDLRATVSKRVCDVRWEVRDSTVEFLGELAALSGNSAAVCSLTPHLLAALQDPESYVRASAIAALAQTFTPRWQQGAPPGPEESALVTRLLDVLSGDTEGFPRRAVVRYFISWLSSWTQNATEPPPPPPSSSSSLLLMTSVGLVLSLGSADLDWEVKVHTLELARLLLRRALPPRAPPPPYGVTGPQVSLSPPPQGAGGAEPGGALAGLVQQGVVSVLLIGLLDCDRPVALEACALLMELRDAVATHAPAAAAVTCELQGVWGQEVAAILLSSGVEVGGGGRAGVCAVLSALDLDARQALLTRSSDHVQNSPRSLLQDILSIRDARAQPANQEVIVDCY